MTEVRKVQKVVKVDKHCDSCGQGLMRPTGVTLMSYPAQYPHVCNGCGAKENFRVRYPYLEHVDANS